MKQRVPDNGASSLLRADSGRAIPPWSDVTRWTDPSDRWGCAPARNRPEARITNPRVSVETWKDIQNHTALPFPERKRETIWLDRPLGDGAGRPMEAEKVALRDALPKFLPLNVHLGVPLSQQTGRPHVKQTAPVVREKRNWMRIIAWGTLVGILLIGMAGALWLGLRVAERNRLLPALPARPAATLPEASVILASDGSELGTLFDERRIWKPLDEMSPVVIDALLAAEDHRFTTHSGVDWIRMAGAFWKTVKGDPEDASTIPMQLARN